jgi:lipopolysaccharide heptosyltransferase II
MNPVNIVVRAPNWVGDAVLSIPALKSLRQRFPSARITLLARTWVAGLFESASFVDQIWRFGPSWVSNVRKMRREGFDTGVLLTNSFASALTMRIGRVAERVGYATELRSALLSHPVPLEPGKHHQTRYYLHLLESAFGPGPSPDIGIRPSADERERARRLLADSGLDLSERFAVLSPGAAFGSAKRWKEAGFAGLADRLGSEGFRTVIVGSAAEREIGDRVSALMRSKATNLAGETDLETLVGLLAEAALVVTNDSGPMHIAAALGTPTVGIFGSTDPEVTGPIGPRARVVSHKVDCSPCLLRKCPIDHRCMENLTVEQVFEAGCGLVAG